MATLSQKVKILQSLITGNAKFADPLFVTFDATRRCNLSCVGCPFHSPHTKEIPLHNLTTGDLSLSVVNKVCDQLIKKSTRTIVIEGSGEPFMNPNIFEIISTIKSYGFYLIILTNGTLLNRYVIEALIKNKVDLIKVSLWANSVEEYVANYPGAGSDNYKKVLNTLVSPI